jgi:Nucleotide-diphospho-sugar transferase
VTKAIPSTGGNTTTTTTGGDDGDATTSQQLHRTKIVGFINERYVNVAIRWYDRLTALGYTEHVIIATDNATSHVLKTSFPQYRIEASYRPPLPQQFWTLPYGKKMRKEVEMLFAYRYVYLLEQLKAGYHVLITDVDNIFSKYHPMSEMEASEFDVFHALENKHPTKVYEAMGFVVCGGMGWFRSSPTTIQFIQLIVDRCGDCCDDQVVLNSILAFDMGMQWNLTDWHKSFRTKNTNQTKLDGLLTKSFTGVSNTTGHKVKLWDHEFAYRGANDPVVCPVNNWVSMPFVIFESRWQGASAKHKSYDIWDSYCPNEYSNNMTKRVEGRLPSENTKI